MNIANLSPQNFDEIISETVRIINSGGIVVAPFDTVYGFICDPYNETAIERIYELKGRDFDKPLGIALNPEGLIEDLVEIRHLDFTRDKVPGPYTFILPLKDKTISTHCQKNGTIAVRVPNNEFILQLSRTLKIPLAQTSANKAGQGSCDSVEQIQNQFSAEELDSIDLIIYGGTIENAKPSEIWDLTGEEPGVIYR